MSSRTTSSALLTVAVALALVALAGCVPYGLEPLDRVERAITKDGEEICSERSPCGWAVYTPFTRRVEYFMRNVCNCPAGRKCIMSSDDLSAKAYVYRCVVPQATTTAGEAAAAS